MTSLDFIRKELPIIAGNFQDVHIKYGYDSIIETHLIELLPLSEYETNKKLDEAWIPMSLRFMELFPNENIAFISSDSFLKIDDILLEFNSNIHIEKELIELMFFELTNIKLKYSFPTTIPAGTMLENSIGYVLNFPIQEIKTEKSLENQYQYLAAA